MGKIADDIVIAVAGTVGIGKSTLTEKLAERLNLKVGYENVDNNPYLEKYYEDFDRWGFHLQIFFLAERFKQQKKIFEYGGGYIQDRTIYEDLEIFAKMNFDNGSMSSEDYKTYKELFESMVMTPFFEKVDIVIYLEGDFEQVVNRLNSRGRAIEIDTDIEYWEKLYRRYEEWIEGYNHTPLLRLNINDYDVENPESIEKIVKKIEKILKVKDNV